MDTPKEILELNTAESLNVARAYAGQIGEMPSSFSSTLRSLIADEEKQKGVLSSTGNFLVSRLLKSRGVLSSVYFAALTFRQKRMAAYGGASVENLIKSFSPGELAFLIGFLYLYRRMKSFASEQLWKELTPPISAALELGGHVGVALPRLGLAMGMCVGGMRESTVALFEKQDPKAFKEYRRHLRSENLAYDLQAEMSYWGCTRFNIGSVFLQQLGFGVSTANAFSLGLSSSQPHGEGLPPDAYRFKIAAIWIDSLLATGQVPEMAHRGEYYPTQAAAPILVQEAGIVRERGSKFSFIEKTKDDVSPEKTPQLFGAAPKAAQEVEAPDPEVEELIKDEDLEKI